MLPSCKTEQKNKHCSLKDATLSFVNPTRLRTETGCKNVVLNTCQIELGGVGIGCIPIATPQPRQSLLHVMSEFVGAQANTPAIKCKPPKALMWGAGHPLPSPRPPNSKVPPTIRDIRKKRRKKRPGDTTSASSNEHACLVALRLALGKRRKFQK